MKIFKNKHFQSLIYSIFLALPMLAVLGRTAYTIMNKNAYLSSSITGVSYEKEFPYETNELNTADDLITGNIYKPTGTEDERKKFIHIDGEYYIKWVDTCKSRKMYLLKI